MNKKKKLLVIVLIVIILLIFSWQFFKVCGDDSNCRNTCCGCISINEKCNILCYFLPERKCIFVNGECTERSKFIMVIENFLRCR